MSIQSSTSTPDEFWPVDMISQGDCVEVMQRLPSESVNCVFADPPYNLQLQGELRRPDDSLVDGVNDEWDRFDDLKAYDKFTRAWLAEAHRVLHKDGTIWVMGSYHNIFRIGSILQDMGFWILNDIIWCKTNPMPNFRGTRFTNAHETIIWAAKSQKSKYCFNYHAMKALNDDKQMRSDWSISICSGKERLRNEHGLKLHPTQKPEELLYRVLRASTDIDDVVLDPFSGTGTTAFMAKRMKRRYIVIERHPDYIKGANERLKQAEIFEDAVLKGPPDPKKLSKVPFQNLVTDKMLKPGTFLYDKARRLKAEITPEGNLQNGQTQASIHKMGAFLTGAPSCNGWTFWHFEQDGKLIAVDALRQEWRKKHASS